MIRVIKTNFSATKETLDLLFTCNRISAQIWNESLRIAKEYALANNGDWINRIELQKRLKNPLSTAFAKRSSCGSQIPVCP